MTDRAGERMGKTSNQASSETPTASSHQISGKCSRQLTENIRYLVKMQQQSEQENERWATGVLGQEPYFHVKNGLGNRASSRRDKKEQLLKSKGGQTEKGTVFLAKILSP